MPNNVIRILHKFFGNQKLRYLFWGGFNTLFGYLSSILIYEFLKKDINIVLIAIIGNFFAISMSFLTYKIFVFRTKGNWISEYLKSFTVYGIGSLFGVIIIYVGVDLMGIQFWQAQGFAILLVTLFSYLSHSRFTFRSK